ncbi:MAG: hypothetical protein AB1846_15110 [Chloroflexota bacterium]
MQKDNIETLLKATRGLFLVNAVIWLAFGIASLVQAASGADPAIWRWVYAVLMLINGGLMLWFGFRIATASRQVFFFAILYVALIIVVSIMDQFGAVDAVFLALNLALLGLLFITRTRILQAG